MQKRARRAARNAEKVARKWDVSNNIGGLTKLALYDIAILCGEFAATSNSESNDY